MHDLQPQADASGLQGNEFGGANVCGRHVRADRTSRGVSRISLQAVSWNAWFALVYLIIAGSIIGFTAYVWLLHYESPTKVGTYAYVNPVVAVRVGYFLGGEAVGPRTLAGYFVGPGERDRDHDHASARPRPEQETKNRG